MYTDRVQETKSYGEINANFMKYSFQKENKVYLKRKTNMYIYISICIVMYRAEILIQYQKEK